MYGIFSCIFVSLPGLEVFQGEVGQKRILALFGIMAEKGKEKFWFPVTRSLAFRM